MSFYSITIVIGVILLMILLFTFKHVWGCLYDRKTDERTFANYAIPVWAAFLFISFVFIPVLGQIILLSGIIVFRTSIESYEVFSFTNLKGLTWEDYRNKTPKYMERYNNAPFYAKICRKLKEFFTYNINV